MEKTAPDYVTAATVTAATVTAATGTAATGTAATGTAATGTAATVTADFSTRQSLNCECLTNRQMKNWKILIFLHFYILILQHG